MYEHVCYVPITHMYNCQILYFLEDFLRFDLSPLYFKHSNTANPFNRERKDRSQAQQQQKQQQRFLALTPQQFYSWEGLPVQVELFRETLKMQDSC
jgi:hypothetical protein